MVEASRQLARNVVNNRVKIGKRIWAAVQLIPKALPFLGSITLLCSSDVDFASHTGRAIGASLRGGAAGAFKTFFYTAVGLGTTIGDVSIWTVTEGIPAAGQFTEEITDSPTIGNLTTFGLKSGFVIAAPLVWIYG